MSGLKNLLVDYRPQRFTDLLGNADIKLEIAAMLRSGEFPPGILLTGPAGCGKTTLGYMIMRRLHCERSSPDQLDPCLACAECDRDLRPESPFQGWGAFVVNCANLSRSKLAELLDVAQYDYPMLTLFLDEAQRATEPMLDQLLTFLEKPRPNMVVILSTISADERVDEALLQRLHHFHLEQPSPNDLLGLLRRLWLDRYQEEPDLTLLAHLVIEYQGIPRKCISALRHIFFRDIRTLAELKRVYESAKRSD